MLFMFMQNVVFHRHVRIVFFSSQPIGQNRCYWLVEQKYNTHVTMKDHIFA
jgi:hypothetical protein